MSPAADTALPATPFAEDNAAAATADNTAEDNAATPTADNDVDIRSTPQVNSSFILHTKPRVYCFLSLSKSLSRPLLSGVFVIGF